MVLKDITLSGIKFKINLDTQSPYQNIINKKGNWEPAVTEAFLKHLKPGMTLLDIGACIGWHTLMGASIMGGKGIVVSFEPDPLYFDILTENVEFNGFKNVKLIKKAASDVNGHTAMLIQKRVAQTGERVGRLLGNGETTQDPVLVEAVTLDSFLPSLGIEKADFVKIDVEGAELKVLHGMKQTIRNSPGLRIVCEVHHRTLSKYGASKKKLLQYVTKELDMKTNSIYANYWIFHNRN